MLNALYVLSYLILKIILWESNTPLSPLWVATITIFQFYRWGSWDFAGGYTTKKWPSQDSNWGLFDSRYKQHLARRYSIKPAMKENTHKTLVLPSAGPLVVLRMAPSLGWLTGRESHEADRSQKTIIPHQVTTWLHKSYAKYKIFLFLPPRSISRKQFAIIFHI